MQLFSNYSITRPNPRGLILALLLCGFALLNWRYRGFGYHSEFASAAIMSAQPLCTGPTSFAVIGDYGDGSTAAGAVAAVIAGWEIDFIATAGDNNYPSGAAVTIDENIGQFYSAYIAPYHGSYGPGAVENSFFPTPGNHDWYSSNLSPYLDYFTLPHNERYYTLKRGEVQLFNLDSDPLEPDGITADSIQAIWLQQELAVSSAVWKIVVMHHPPYSSGLHGSTTALQWPFAEWGADAVISGHDHTYERLQKDGISYFVNGLGGRSIYNIGVPLPESVVRYNLDYGAMKVTAGPHCLTFQFFNIANEEIDRQTLINLEYYPQKIFLPAMMHGE